MKTTLKRVQTRAMSNPKFFQALLADADRALADNKIELSAADDRRLREILALGRQQVYVDLESHMKRARRIRGRDGLFWLAMWAPEFSMFPGMPISKIPINIKKPR